MTFVEFFDKTATENIAACLTYAPERVIFIGDDSKQMKRHIENYRSVFSKRGNEIEFLFKTTSKSNLENAIKLISSVVEAYDDCIFDITGGSEILLLALGCVYERYPEKNIQIHRFNVNNNTFADCDKDGVSIYKRIPRLTVDENIKLYGGDVVYGGIDSENTYKWDLESEFVKDIGAIWDACKGDVRLWNMQVNIFEAIERAGISEGMTTTADISAVENQLLRFKAKYKTVNGLIEHIIKMGLLTEYDDGDEKKVRITYKNPQVKKCLTKAGQALEMKIYTAALAVTDNEGNPFYNDVKTGVVIDWDGKHNDDSEDYDTENEIDVLLMHNTVPVFISCKNGSFDSNELYKLNTVANRFGGPYAKKVLVTTALSLMGDSAEYIRTRATDMGVIIIENIQKLDDEELLKKLKNICA